MTVDPTSKSIRSSFCESFDVGGVAFVGLPFLEDTCAGISRRGGIEGLRIDLGGGCGTALSDLVC